VFTAMIRPTFFTCGTISEEAGQSGPRWAKKWMYDLTPVANPHGSIPPSKYLEAVNMLLCDEAELWAESTPEVADLLEDESPTVIFR
ncbi:hypothetical protein MMC12_008059, partial [Toensbergia leucococca]|nr:hypothetical protein [Toensbergia leucococca]